MSADTLGGQPANSPSIDDWKKLRADITNLSGRWAMHLSSFERLLQFKNYIPEQVKSSLPPNSSTEPEQLRETAILLCTHINHLEFWRNFASVLENVEPISYAGRLYSRDTQLEDAEESKRDAKNFLFGSSKPSNPLDPLSPKPYAKPLHRCWRTLSQLAMQEDCIQGILSWKMRRRANGTRKIPFWEL
ncbi:hypothetical protein R3P38DRAFT_2814040 [Favolaschia claudopus]|uniref:Uncharacterized protein n=1 Tax=Favolaschia claudopus TaxID=2862362 RepID=A0AAV9Z433_9AGAR